MTRNAPMPLFKRVAEHDREPLPFCSTASQPRA